MKSLDARNLDIIYNWRNSPEIKAVSYTDHDISVEEHLAWFNRMENSEKDTVLILYHDDKPLGLVHFSELNRHHMQSFWGFYIGNPNPPKRSGTILGMLAMDYIFEQGFKKINAEVLSFNERSIYFHQKLGFEKEGYFKNHIFKKGKYVDVIRLALFRDTWQHNRPLLYEEVLNEYPDWK